MTKIVTAVYESKDTTDNVYDDLIATGIPAEEIRVEDSKHQVQVMSPNAVESEITEILERHKPIEIKH